MTVSSPSCVLPATRTPSPGVNPETAGDLPFQFRGDPGREAVVLRVPENMDP